MKQKIIGFYTLAAVLLGIVFLNSCQQVDFDDPMEQIETKSASEDEINYNVSLKSARYLVQSTEGGNEITSVEPIVFQGDTLMYIFNFDEGWQVVSGDKRTDPILASDEQGSLSSETLENPGVATWLSDVADQISNLKEHSSEADYSENVRLWNMIDKASHLSAESLDKYRKKYNAIYSTQDNKQLKSTAYPAPPGYRWEKRLVSVRSTPWVTTKQKGPLLQTKWGQRYPWNTDVPRYLATLDDGSTVWKKCPTGCVAVAISQVLYNLHYNIGKPTFLYHNVTWTGAVIAGKYRDVSFSRSEKNHNSNRWDYMKKSTSTGGIASYVGDLMADVGNRVKMKYGEQSSASAESEAIPTFNSYGVFCSKADYNYHIVYSNLTRNLPVIVRAYSAKKYKGSWFWKRAYYTDGHAWVIDGFRVRKKTYSYVYRWELIQDDPYYPYDPYDPYSPPFPGQYSYGYDRVPTDFPPSGVYPGMTEKETKTSTSTFLIMNWGWDGSYDSGNYSTSSSAIWRGSGYNFQYKKRIFYNFH